MNPESKIPGPQTPVTKAGPGRPRVLNDAKRSEVCALVAGGCSIYEAARYVRCSYNTIRREAKRDPDFQEHLRRSELYAQLSPLRAMQQAVATHWRAAAWMLERAYPERFARRDPALLGPRQASELYDEVRNIINAEVPDPVLCMRLEKRLRTPFSCFIRATGDSRRTSRDLREAIKFFQEKDRLEDVVPRFGYSDPLPYPSWGSPPKPSPSAKNQQPARPAAAPDT